MNNQPTPDPGITIQNSFVRGRNVLIAKGDFTSLFMDYYEHLSKNEIQMDANMAERFRDMLAAFTLHSASRPRNEVLAWTVHYESPLHNIFLGSDTEYGFVTGRLFTEGVKEGEENVFYQEQVIQGKPLRRSIVSFDDINIKGTVEAYYAQSEQRPAKFFHLAEDEFALVTAHPDYDESWFEALNLDELMKIDEKETVNLLETRAYRWFCQCHHDKILDILAPLMEESPEHLFGSDEIIQVNCPRCGARYRVSRESLENKITRNT